jgi:hypothetical protein
VLAAAAVCAALTGAPRVDAGPITSPLSVLRKAAHLVVIGRVDYVGSKIAIDVEKVVHGIGSAGRLEVTTDHQASSDVKEGERTVLVVDDKGVLRYAGSLLVGPSVEAGVLHLRGFYDHADHGVTPGILSLDQLTSYLRYGTLAQQVDATLAFPDEKGGREISPSRFTVSWDPLEGRVGVMQLPAACLEGKPTLAVSSEGGGKVTLRFVADCPSGKSPDVDRGLVLAGRLSGVDPTTGVFTAELSPVDPYLSAKDFALFAKDPAIAGVEQAVGVRLESGATWTWRLGLDLSPPAGPAVPASGAESGAETDTYTFGATALTISPRAETNATGGHGRSILEIVDRGPPERCELVEGGKPARKCTLVRKPPRFVRIKR